MGTCTHRVDRKPAAKLQSRFHFLKFHYRSEERAPPPPAPSESFGGFGARAGELGENQMEPQWTGVFNFQFSIFPRFSRFPTSLKHRREKKEKEKEKEKEKT